MYISIDNCSIGAIMITIIHEVGILKRWVVWNRMPEAHTQDLMSFGRLCGSAERHNGVV